MAVHCEVVPICTEVGLQETETEVMVDDVTLTFAVPVLLVSWADLAAMVTEPAVAGAVKRPEELMVPALSLQVTAGL